ncbi:hypothetical protein KIW84_030819 [Lathyrus oleraceus]|uniref:Pectinesterase n=1 Tax=Pisum sativum TaxID=3888 RepID=A0A9D4XU68_PEA|nr:hypothetical protein KIW84_030819 [Pisum sativum]
MSGKVVISVVSLILVVGVAIGVVAVVHKNGQDPEMKTQQRSVQIICQNAEDKDLCQDTLKSVNGVESADPKAYIAAAVKATTDSVIKAFNMSDRLSTEYGSQDGGIKMALDDCKDLLQFAMDSLEMSTNLVRDNNIQAVHSQTPDLRNWLSAVISYQQSCMEGFDDEKDGEKKIKDQFHVESLDGIQKITSVALDIVSGLSNILQQFNLKLDLQPASRRLLAEDIDNEGFPTWFSGSDRKLLASMQGKGWRSKIVPNVIVAKDGFDDEKDGEKKIKDQFHVESLDGVQKITSVALDIMSGLSNILQQFNLKLDLQPASRRLLAEDIDNEGFPTWFSGSDRKLLASMQGKGWRSKVVPNVIVAKDGTGKFRTIKEAIASYPSGNKGRYVIYVKAGVYDEYITVPKTAANILMYGDGPQRTIVTGKKCFANGVKTMLTATFANTAPGFIGKAMTFENTAGPDGHQAVALRNQGDMSAFVGCHILGYQDTLYVQTNRQFYRNCVISGTIDFIFGISPTLIQHSVIIVRKPNMNQFSTVTADGTAEKNMATGIVIQDCQIVPESQLFPVRFQVKSYLGRPWKAYSRTVVMESTIGDFIHPDGWFPWTGSNFENTLYYAEYANTGPGADVSKRIKWKGYRGIISRAEANQFTAAEFLKAGPQSGAEWLKAIRVPHYLGFKA